MWSDNRTQHCRDRTKKDSRTTDASHSDHYSLHEVVASEGSGGLSSAFDALLLALVVTQCGPSLCLWFDNGRMDMCFHFSARTLDTCHTVSGHKALSAYSFHCPHRFCTVRRWNPCLNTIPTVPESLESSCLDLVWGQMIHYVCSSTRLDRDIGPLSLLHSGLHIKTCEGWSAGYHQ